MKGICLRGQPGWGQVFAPLTTVVNTFGGTWFDKDWNAQVNSPEFTEAVEFYVNLVRDHGRAGAAQAGFTECLNNMSQGKVAMWYDATSAAGALEAEDSPVKGKIGYAQAPVKETKSSGWLWTWSWAVQAATKKQDAAGKFISWASSKEYEELVGVQARLVQGPVRQAHLHLREHRVPGGRTPSSSRTLRHRERRPDQPRRAAAADRGHPVRRHPRVHRPRHQGVPGRQLRHRRPEDRRRRPGQGAGSRTKSRRQVQVTTTQLQENIMTNATARVSRHGSTTAKPSRDARRRRGTGRGLGTACTAAAGPDLHDHRDPAAVRGDAGHLVHELERLPPGHDRVRRVRQLRPGLHRPLPSAGGRHHHPA